MKFIDLGIVDPCTASCSEQALFESHRSALMIYSRNRPTISLGRFGDSKESIYADNAEKNNMTVVRRLSGGSAIFCDENQITYSVVIERSRFDTKEEAYRTICSCVVSGLKFLGVNAVYKPVNDILVDGKKISGSAQYRDQGYLMQHGSIILRLDQKTMDSVLKPLKERKYPGLTSVEEALGRIPSREEIVSALINGFSTLETIEKGSLDDERERIDELTSRFRSVSF
ncbi:MAG: biotin/lipoate A/B protein ligase family protein [Candidatus Methanomethylophilaceae archaeon]